MKITIKQIEKMDVEELIDLFWNLRSANLTNEEKDAFLKRLHNLNSLDCEAVIEEKTDEVGWTEKEKKKYCLNCKYNNELCIFVTDMGNSIDYCPLQKAQFSKEDRIQHYKDALSEAHIDYEKEMEDFATNDKEYCNFSSGKYINELEIKLYLTENDIDFTTGNQNGTLKIGEYIYFMPSSKWRRDGKRKIYWSKGIEDFVTNYIIDKDETKYGRFFYAEKGKDEEQTCSNCKFHEYNLDWSCLECLHRNECVAAGDVCDYYVREYDE